MQKSVKLEEMVGPGKPEEEPELGGDFRNEWRGSGVF